MKLVRAALVLVVVLLAGAAPAQPPRKAERVVLAPIAGISRDPAEQKLAAQIETSLLEAARRVPTIEIVNVDANGRLRGPSRIDAKADPRPQARAQTLAREQGAELAIVAEAQPLGEGAVVYLQVLEPGGKPRGSTTVALSAETLKAGPVELERPLRGGLVQILDPARFVGRVELRIDVKGAQIDIGGRRQPAVENAPTVIELPVGTHAIRVTQAAYRDYVRFVEVAFDKTQVENVAMAAFPLTEGEMAEKRRASGVTRKVPWYRSWWALGLTGAVLVGVTAGIVYGVRPGVSADEHTSFRAPPAP